MFTIEPQVMSRLLGKERLMFGWAMLRPHLPGGMRVCMPKQAAGSILNRAHVPEALVSVASSLRCRYAIVVNGALFPKGSLWLTR